MKKKVGVVLCLVAVGWGVVGYADGSVPSGKDLFGKKMCAACHGRDGSGGAVKVPLKGTKKTKAEIIAFIKKGSEKMKPVKGTDEELALLADYILSLKDGK